MRTAADYVVVGSGVAGLYFAVKAAEHGSVILVTKSAAEESNTSYAQGGIAAVVDPADTCASHAADTLAAGDGLSDPQVVEFIVARGAKVVAALEGLGARFTRDRNGNLSLFAAARTSPVPIQPSSHPRRLTVRRAASASNELSGVDLGEQAANQMAASVLLPTQSHSGEKGT